MFCSNCGSIIVKSVKFCPNCGEKIEYDVVPVSQSSNDTEHIFTEKDNTTFNGNEFWQRFNLQGRRGRQAYFVYWCIEIALFILLSFVPLLYVLPIWIDISNDVKRLHDIGLSGFYVIGFFIGDIVLSAVFPLLAIIFELGVTVFLFFKEGMPYENKYGAVQ